MNINSPRNLTLSFLIGLLIAADGMASERKNEELLSAAAQSPATLTTSAASATMSREQIASMLPTYGIPTPTQTQIDAAMHLRTLEDIPAPLADQVRAVEYLWSTGIVSPTKVQIEDRMRFEWKPDAYLKSIGITSVSDREITAFHHLKNPPIGIGAPTAVQIHAVIHLQSQGNWSPSFAEIEAVVNQQVSATAASNK